MDKKKALVIIDMQMGFMNDNTKHLEDKIEKFINEHEGVFDKIIATAYINSEHTACYVFEHWDKCMANTVDTYLVPKVHSKIDICFEKDVYSCYSEKFKEYLRHFGIEEVYLCGVNTGCCVLHSAFDMYNDLVSCYVIEDLCGSTSGSKSHEAAIQVLEECITKDRVIHSSSV